MSFPWSMVFAVRECMQCLKQKLRVVHYFHIIWSCYILYFLLYVTLCAEIHIIRSFLVQFFVTLL